MPATQAATAHRPVRPAAKGPRLGSRPGRTCSVRKLQVLSWRPMPQLRPPSRRLWTQSISPKVIPLLRWRMERLGRSRPGLPRPRQHRPPRCMHPPDRRWSAAATPSRTAHVRAQESMEPGNETRGLDHACRIPRLSCFGIRNQHSAPPDQGISVARRTVPPRSSGADAVASDHVGKGRHPHVLRTGHVQPDPAACPSRTVPTILFVRPQVPAMPRPRIAPWATSRDQPPVSDRPGSASLPAEDVSPAAKRFGAALVHKTERVPPVTSSTVSGVGSMEMVPGPAIDPAAAASVRSSAQASSATAQEGPATERQGATADKGADRSAGRLPDGRRDVKGSSPTRPAFRRQSRQAALHPRVKGRILARFTPPADEGRSAREVLASARPRIATRCCRGASSPRRSFRCAAASGRIPRCRQERGSRASRPTG